MPSLPIFHLCFSLAVVVFGAVADVVYGGGRGPFEDVVSAEEGEEEDDDENEEEEGSDAVRSEVSPRMAGLAGRQRY